MVAARCLRPGLLTATVALAFATGSAGAQTLGSAFTYQGHLTDSGVAASGLFDLQVCLYDVAAGSNPLQCATDHNDVPVDEGVFTLAVDFGSTAFIGQQRFLELRVRPGASTAAYTVLAPRQLLRAAPEALRANVASAAPWSGLTGVPTGFADGIDNNSGGTVNTVITGAGLTGGPITASGTVAIATGGVTTAMISAGAIGNAQLAGNSVDGARVVDDSLAAADIGANAIGPSELANNAVDTAALADASVTMQKIAAGAIGAAQINSAQVQTRITGACPPEMYFRGVNADGSLNCELLPVAIVRRLAPTAVAGGSGALALRAGNLPIVSYVESTTNDLKLYDCADQSCSSGVVRTLDDVATTGSRTRIAIRPDGRPVIAYYDTVAGDLLLYDCNNAACSSGSARALVSAGDVGSHVSIAVRADGRAILAFYADDPSRNLMIYDCANVACSSGTSRTLDFTGDVGKHTGIALRPSGVPVISYYDATNTDLKVYNCTSADCSSGSAYGFPSNGGDAGLRTSIAVQPDGFVVISYLHFTAGVQVVRCQSLACDGGLFILNTLPTNEGSSASLALRPTGWPVVALQADSDLVVFSCASSLCNSRAAVTVETVGDTGEDASLELRSDGRPVIVHHDPSNAAIRLYICPNELCE